MFKPIRWSGNRDRYFGPFTYTPDAAGETTYAIVLDSGRGDGDEDSGCHLRISGFRHTLIMALPPILRPYRWKIDASSWNEDDIARMGRNWYWGIDSRRLGISVTTGFLQFFHGRQTHDSSTDHTWSTFLPWTEWRHVRHSFYDLEGNHFWTEETGMDWQERREKEEKVPAIVFAFDDFDGERVHATTRISEREWHRGVRWCKWLSWFVKPKISRTLNLEFSSGIGQRKNSWKGGTTGHTIEMLPGELHEEAFRRYCAENDLIFHSGNRYTLRLS